MQEMMTETEKKELEKERFELALERIEQIPNEKKCADKYQDYFEKMAEFVLFMKKTWDFVADGSLYKVSLEELQNHNKELYADIIPENYEKSYANPAYAAECFGKEMGQLLSFVYAELRSMIAAAYEQSLTDMVIRMELLLEIYQAFLSAAEDCENGQAVPEYETLRQIAYWYVSDYYEIETYERVAGLLLPEKDFATKIIMESDLSDIRYLYYYGEYVTENEIRTAKHMTELSAERHV